MQRRKNEDNAQYFQRVDHKVRRESLATFNVRTKEVEDVFEKELALMFARAAQDENEEKMAMFQDAIGHNKSNRFKSTRGSSKTFG